MKIPFNKPPLVGSELAYITEALKSGKLSGDGHFSEKCKRWFETRLTPSKVLLTPNCTQALEMAAMLLDIKAGDEVIMPSYTFVSTANAFVIRGARLLVAKLYLYPAVPELRCGRGLCGSVCCHASCRPDCPHTRCRQIGFVAPTASPVSSL